MKCWYQTNVAGKLETKPVEWNEICKAVVLLLADENSKVERWAKPECTIIKFSKQDGKFFKIKLEKGK